MQLFFRLLHTTIINQLLLKCHLRDISCYHSNSISSFKTSFILAINSFKSPTHFSSNYSTQTETKTYSYFTYVNVLLHECKEKTQVKNRCRAIDISSNRMIYVLLLNVLRTENILLWEIRKNTVHLENKIMFGRKTVNTKTGDK